MIEKELKLKERKGGGDQCGCHSDNILTKFGLQNFKLEHFLLFSDVFMCDSQSWV
jgi:hypothetical protein